jgi:DNA-binding transcriptional MerR regulator
VTEPLQRLRIAEIADQTGLTVDTLRSYKRLGLLPPSARSSDGVHHYAPDVVRRVRFVRGAQILGLSVDEIRTILGDGSRVHGETCLHVHNMLTRRLADVDQLLAQLHELRNTLSNYLHRCEVVLDQQLDLPCPTMDALEQSFALPFAARDTASVPTSKPRRQHST